MLWPISRVTKDLGKSVSHRHGSQPVERLFFDAWEASSDVRLVDWQAGCFQVLICEFCASEGCASQGWITLRRAGAYVLWMPTFDRLEVGPQTLPEKPPEDRLSVHGLQPFNRAWFDAEYGPPDYVYAKGIPLLDRDRYGQARNLVPALPRIEEIPPLTAHEAVRMMQWESPRSAWIWGQDAEHVNASGFVLAIGGGSGGEVEIPARRLDVLLERWRGCSAPVSLTPAQAEERPVTFFVDAYGFPEWSPLILRDGIPCLYVVPGYVVTKT